MRIAAGVWCVVLAIFSVGLLTGQIDIPDERIGWPWNLVILLAWFTFAGWFIASNRPRRSY